jgi:hypothetical protein
LVGTSSRSAVGTDDSPSNTRAARVRSSHLSQTMRCFDAREREQTPRVCETSDSSRSPHRRASVVARSTLSCSPGPSAESRPRAWSMPSEVRGGSFGLEVLSLMSVRRSRTDPAWRSFARSAIDSRSVRSEERLIRMWSPHSMRCVRPYERAGSRSSPGRADGGVQGTGTSQNCAGSLPRIGTGISIRRRGACCRERGVVTGKRMRSRYRGSSR